ncbi:MAG: hypothetical protein LBD29_01110 [Treponema sp.]|nr:hypothetical protein [Treponema sp.]
MEELSSLFENSTGLTDLVLLAVREQIQLGVKTLKNRKETGYADYFEKKMKELPLTSKEEAHREASNRSKEAFFKSAGKVVEEGVKIIYRIYSGS